MDRFEVMRSACHDELKKIAGELQGMVRAGRRPISVDNYLQKEVAKETRPSDFVEEVVKESGIFGGAKAAAKGVSMGRDGALLAGGLAAGATGLHVAQKANEDRKLGRQIRIQQRG